MAGGSTKVVIAALVGNAAIAITKFAASVATGSSAMFAEAIHSLVDTGNQGLLLLGIKRAARPADAAHPFGYGKEIYFWAFVVAIILFALGAGVSIYEGIIKIRHPHEITNAGWNYAVLALAGLFEAGAWFVAFREFNKVRGKTPFFRAIRRSKDPALFTVLFEDTAALMGLFVAFCGILAADQFGLTWADGLATLTIGIILAVAAIILAIETKGLLIGESASPAVLAEVRDLAQAQGFVCSVNEIRTMHLGPEDVLLAMSVDPKNALNGGRIEAGVTALETAIKTAHPEMTRVFIEIQSKNDSETTPLSKD